MARSFNLSALFSEQLCAPQLCSLEILGWLGASRNSSLASCSKGYCLRVATFRKNLKKIVLDKHWHHDHLAGLFEHRHLEELVILGETEIIQTPLPQPLGRKHFDWDGGKVWRLIDLNSSTLKRAIFKSVVLAEPDHSQVPEDDINAERFEVYFHHLYRCASLETLELHQAPPPDRFPVNSFVREVFGRLRHLELSAGDYTCRFDHEEFGECVARALRQAQHLETLFLTWHPWDHDAERGDFAFIEVWESTTLPQLRRLRLRGDVLYREDCDGITQFLNRHSHTMERLQLQLSNKVAATDRDFVCPEQTFPHLGSLPKLKELVVPLPKTYAGNVLMREHASIVPRMRFVCMPLLQIQAKCPSLECLIFLAEVEYAHVQGIPKEIGHVEVSRVVCETKQLFLRDGKQQLQTVYFLEGERSLLAPRSCIDDVPLDWRLGEIHEAPSLRNQKLPNAFMLDACGLLSACHVGLAYKGFSPEFISSVQNRVAEVEIPHS